MIKCVGSTDLCYLNFQRGDIVRVNFYGMRYTTFQECFNYFFGKWQQPTNISAMIDTPQYKKKLWIVKNLAFHPLSKGTVLVHLEDKLGNRIVMSHKGLEVVKNNKPLEDKTITLHTINHPTR